MNPSLELIFVGFSSDFARPYSGTYVKELVHGEFGRTSPSICSTIGQWIDIVALDVMAIDLDWPAEVDNQHELNGNGAKDEDNSAVVAVAV